MLGLEGNKRFKNIKKKKIRKQRTANDSIT